ncbi:MAG TPA: ATP-dependent helicase [Candidatus Kapabacteria bacterium]|nr:ATP-dependent helicase [Candidatus Kapabacteria bacterium]
MSNFTNVWREGLSGEQINAAGHIGTHALLLSGPGTGKTKIITHRILALLIEHKVPPENVLVLTFTRVAAHQLKKEIEDVLRPFGSECPHISTLHSFALRQLLKNSSQIDSLPMPLRIADDWEERNIICENLKNDLAEHLKSILPNIQRPIDKIKTLFNQLSADWETLSIEGDEIQRTCRDAKFIGAWREHREMFGYILRSELVYQLKKSLEQIPDFRLESKFNQVLVDEYQDLNLCDLAVIDELSKKGGELFVAGDDDQSIYSFRYANPIGIRIFPKKYKAKIFNLEICYRCDKSILDLAEFIANLDYQRLLKRTRPRVGASEGEVKLLRFSDQYHEAEWIASKCKEILEINDSTRILILMRSDSRGRISQNLKDAFDRQNVPVAIETDETPLDTNEGRTVLSIIRLLVNPQDSLAWYTLLYLERGIGEKTLSSVRQIAKEKGYRFYDALEEISETPGLFSAYELPQKLQEIKKKLEMFGSNEKSVREQVHDIITSLVSGSEKQVILENHLNQIILETESNSLSDLLGSISVSMENAEQELRDGMVNIMTMHKAKGLSSDVVFILGAESQFIPGKNIGPTADDERRLFYVSLTRARHSLFITCCKERTNDQRYLGSDSGNSKRDLTPFLRDSSLKPEDIL